MLYQLVKDFKDGEFAAIIHDPPARALCKTTDMYGSAFYKDLARVLKYGGTLFHYVGNPSSTWVAYIVGIAIFCLLPSLSAQYFQLSLSNTVLACFNLPQSS